MKMKFPIIKGEDPPFYPRDRICPVCKEELGGQFVVINGGALWMDHTTESGGMHENMEGFMSIHYHGDHNKGEHAFVSLDVIEGSSMGQFDIYVCSAKCLRKFFEVLVRKFEEKIRDRPPSVPKERGDK